MHVTDAVRRVSAWLDQPHLQVLTPGDRYGEILFDLLLHLGTAGTWRRWRLNTGRNWYPWTRILPGFQSSERAFEGKARAWVRPIRI